MTAVVTPDGDRRWRANCVDCFDAFSRANRATVQRWADDHNRTYHAAPGQPDSDPRDPALISVDAAPARDRPGTASVQIRFRRGNTTDVIQITRAEALDLQRHLNHYLKASL